ncbi:twitchin-like [Mercenaria mercenaria]|uniref:twitchin-like n=1 Tax=Mercenaria mercenaria TaxID=6596 RepID=UPI00234F6B94|nr:twitchin-like [Mercenaria mercenaria]
MEMLTSLKRTKMFFFLLGLFNPVDLRPRVDWDKYEALNYRQSTSNHSYVCSTGRQRSLPGITYDKKGRYYSISYHGICPHPEMKDWKCNADYKKCINGTTYHCARDSITGAFTDACAFPVFCGKGKEPIIQYPEGLAKIDCRYCEEDHFNPANISSDTYSECEKKRAKCRQGEEIECLTEGYAKYWTQRRCKCNWKMNYIPRNLKTLKNLETTDKFCLEDVTCIFYKCNTRDGKRQQRLPDYSCAEVCDPDFHRINESGECVLKESNVTKEGTSTANVFSVPTTKTTTTQKKLSSMLSTGITPSKSNNDSRTLPTTTKTDVSKYWVGIVIGIAIGIIAVGACGFVVWCRFQISDDKRQNGKSDNHNPSPPGTPEYVSSTEDSIQIRWDPPDGNEAQPFIGSYEIEIREAGHQAWKSLGEATYNRCTARGLKQETSYEFRVTTFHKGKTFCHFSDPIPLQRPSVVPEIRTRLGDTIARKGTPVTIRVIYKCTSVPDVIWKKGDDVHEEEDDRVTFKHDDVEAACVMEVRSAERKDSGKYTIILKNEKGSCQKSFQIIVKDVPGMPVGPLTVNNVRESENKYRLTWKPPEDNGGSEIDNYVVEQESETGEWKPYIAYVRETSYILDLTQERKEYRFRVKAKNEQGFSVPCEMETPFILSAPKVNQEVKDYVAVEGNPCNVSVPYSGVPKPDVHWTKNGVAIKEESERISFKTDHKNISLELNPTVKTDRGKYSVKLRNPFGTDEVSFYVHIKYKPGKPEGPLTFKRLTSTECLLNWKPTGDPGGSVIKYRVEKSESGRWVKYLTTVDTSCSFSSTPGLERNHFRVSAKNEQGYGESLSGEPVEIARYSHEIDTADSDYEYKRYSAPSDKNQPTSHLKLTKIRTQENENDSALCVSGQQEALSPPASFYSVDQTLALPTAIEQTNNKKNKEDAKSISLTMDSVKWHGNISGNFELETKDQLLSYKQKKRASLPSSGIISHETRMGNSSDNAVEMKNKQSSIEDQDDDETFRSVNPTK